ncbi:MAG: hypothetical protein ACTHOU_19560 [Aureliella sp.]
MFSRCFACSMLGLAALALSGCGESGPATGTVSGKVLIGGAPPAEPVRVQFINSIIGQGAFAVSQADGSYSLDHPIQVGEYTIYLEKIVESDQPISTNAEQLKSVPKEYRTEMTSPLKKEVKEGANTIDLDIPKA